LLIRTYIDSGVLIFASKGTSETAALALPFITDKNREYVTSDYIKLEVLPKAIFHKNKDEVEFYNTFFAMNIRCIPPSSALMEWAMEEASKTGMSGIDALHVAAAVFAGATELITNEKNTKPIHRTAKVKVISIFP
jgi:predicted nucleic acid-binding protein